ncbi:hypothetical protein FBD94_16685 [Pedobacter hiemivivus]|uniref:WG repeat-containing protein n=1 Tax=Pedobacter hiemivivus TaxID=2530454 RepID=A0A4U1G6C3_9SPHI|nr:hypothetical protein [Pedobacter hiemivivus]TKC59168.1 hypothetical protein FBD94_16685 [Pedobacter hiemivivus]
MKNKISYSNFVNAKCTLFFTFFLFSLTTFGQSQSNIIKKTEWNGMVSFVSKYGVMFQNQFGQTLELSDNNTAMIIGTPKVDFAIVNIDGKLTQKWITPLKGYPLGIGKFHGAILVIAAADKGFANNMTPIYKAYVLEEQTGKLISEKIIYEGNEDYLEDHDLFFAKDGSYFMMSVRHTEKKRKVGIFNTEKAESDFKSTTSFTLIDFDRQLNQREKTNPVIPKGESWMVSDYQSGRFLISAIDKAAGKLNVATYVASSPDPLVTVSIPIDLHKSGDIYSAKTISAPDSLINYMAIIYLNQNREVALSVAKIHFNTRTYSVINEVFDKKHMKELKDSFVASDKKNDDLTFSSPNFFGIRSVELYGNKLMVALSSRYVSSYNKIVITAESSMLLNVYDKNLKKQYHQFLPREFYNMTNQGFDVAFNLKGSTLKMLYNKKSNVNSDVVPIYSEMDIENGKILKMNKIMGAETNEDYFMNTKSVSWMDQSCVIPYLDRQRAFSIKLGMQMQLVNH